MKTKPNKTHSTRMADNASVDLSGSVEPEIPCLDAATDAAVVTHGEQSPSTLAEAEAQLRSVAARYSQSGEEQFTVLKTICRLVFTLKQIFEATPRHLRPVHTWAKYAPAVAKRCGLRFQSERMADHYARLHVDLLKVDPAEIQKRVSDGSYREARKAANDLIKTSTGKKDPANTSKLLQQGSRLVRKAMDEGYDDGHLRSLGMVQQQLGKAARADRERNDNVVPELATMGLPDRERRRINFAVRAEICDPVAAGIHAFDQCLFDHAPLVEGAITLPAWSRPNDIALPLDNAGMAKWTESWDKKRRTLITALVRRFGTQRKAPPSNQAVA